MLDMLMAAIKVSDNSSLKLVLVAFSRALLKVPIFYAHYLPNSS